MLYVTVRIHYPNGGYLNQISQPGGNPFYRDVSMYIYVLYLLSTLTVQSNRLGGGPGSIIISTLFYQSRETGRQARVACIMPILPWAASKKPGSTTAAHGYPAYKVGPRGQNGWQNAKCNESSGPDIIVSGFVYHEQV